MDRFNRQMLAEVIAIFLLGTAVSGLLMTIGMGAAEGIRRGLTATLIVQSLPFTAPETLRFTIPGCFLFAVCTVFGRLSQNNELVALSSLGVSLMKLARPVIVLSVVLSMCTFLLYELCAAWARPHLRKIVAESFADVAYNLLRNDQSFSAKGISLAVRRVDGKRLVEPVMLVNATDTKPRMRLTAREAHLAPADGGRVLRVECREAELDIDGRGVLNRPAEFVYEIPIGGQGPVNEDWLSPAALKTNALPRQIQREKRLVTDLTGRMKSTADSSKADLKQLESELMQHQNRLHRLRAESPRRLANGFACLGFCLIGIPVAVRLRAAGSLSVFFICFLPVLLLYYPLLILGETIARRGILPEFSVWLGDAVMLFVGAWLMRQAFRR